MSHLMFTLPLLGICHDEIAHYSTKCLNSYYENLFPFLMPIIIIVSCYFFIPRLLSYKKTQNVWRWISNHFKLCFGIVFVSGFILYFIGYSHNIEGENFWLYSLSTFQAGGRAMLSSLSMFVFDTDFIEVGEAYHHNIFYLVAFALIHFLGVLISTHFIIRLLGTRLISKIKMSNFFKSESKTDERKEIFVFWGINEESITLGKSIFDYHKNNGTEGKIKLLFVETPSEKELEIKEYSFTQFLNSSLHNNNGEDRIEALDGISLYPKRRLIEVEKEFPGQGEKIFRKLGIHDLYKLCNLPCNAHFFFLSDDEQKNIQDTLIIQELFKEKAAKQKLHLYCKSRDNYANRAIINAKGFFITKLIDDAALSITTLKELKNNEKYPAHPINYVDPDPKRGVVQNPFTALIIGFGTAGQDALRFLYEYGTFVKSPGEESTFKCYIIDKEMNNIKGQFIREVPAFECDKQSNSMKNIEFLHLDWNSETLKKMFTNVILNELNYVLIATGNDQSNMTIATELYEYVLKNRKNGFLNFHIFVRVYDKENEKQMEAISSFYKTNDQNDVITVFGKQNDIYTYRNIIENKEKEKQARVFFEMYQKVSNGNEIWEECERDMKNPKTPYAKRLEIIHKKGQNCSNVLHMYTKLKLCQYTSRELPNWELFPFKTEEIEDENEKHFLECLNNLSELEHLRWNAAHYMAGFVYAEEKDFRKKTHPCLKPFKDLDDSIKRYDYATVITTIELDKRNYTNDNYLP